LAKSDRLQLKILFATCGSKASYRIGRKRSRKEREENLDFVSEQTAPEYPQAVSLRRKSRWPWPFAPSGRWDQPSLMTSSEISSVTSWPFSMVQYLKGLPRLVVPRMVPPRGRIPAHIVERELVGFLWPDQAVEAIRDADDFPFVLQDGALDRGANHRVEAGCVAAAGADPYSGCRSWNQNARSLRVRQLPIVGHSVTERPVIEPRS
jgi:hypothetical protein